LHQLAQEGICNESCIVISVHSCIFCIVPFSPRRRLRCVWLGRQHEGGPVDQQLERQNGRH